MEGVKKTSPHIDEMAQFVDEARLRSRVARAVAVGGGVAEMERKSGIPRGTLEKYVAQTSTPSFLNAVRIAISSGISLDEIVTMEDFPSNFGAARGLRAVLDRIAAGPNGGWKASSQEARPTTVDAAVTDLDQPGMIAIPRYDEVRPSAGHGAVATRETPTTRVAFERHWLTEIGVQADKAVILPAQGDSMEPTIMNGSPMLVDRSKTEIQNGFIYVIAVGNDLLVKRVRRRLDGRIDLISDNRAYDPETLDDASLRQLRVIGRVYAAVSKF